MLKHTSCNSSEGLQLVHQQISTALSRSKHVLYNNLRISRIDTECVHTLRWFRLMHDTRITTHSSLIIGNSGQGPHYYQHCYGAGFLFIIPHSIRTSAYPIGVRILHYLGPQIARSLHSAHRYPLLFIRRPRHCWTSLRRVVCGM